MTRHERALLYVCLCSTKCFEGAADCAGSLSVSFLKAVILPSVSSLPRSGLQGSEHRRAKPRRCSATPATGRAGRLLDGLSRSFNPAGLLDLCSTAKHVPTITSLALNPFWFRVSGSSERSGNRAGALCSYGL